MTKCAVNKDVLDDVINSLVILRGAVEESAEPPSEERGRGKTRLGATNRGEKVDPTNLNAVLNQILSAVGELMKEVAALKEAGVGQRGAVVGGEAGKSLTDQVNIQADEIDEMRQRSLKGNLILSSPNLPAIKKVSLIKSDEQIKKEGSNLTQHVLELLKTKYGTDVPEGDIQALHRLPNGTIILRLWNRKPGSAWADLVNGIRSGKNREINFFANFHLTKRRNSLLYEVRQLKKSGQIWKFYTDENGTISFRAKDGGNKIRATYTTKPGDKFGQPFTLRGKDDILEALK